MSTRAVSERVSWVGAVDWNRRLFDSLIPLPDGTSYNAYLVVGSEKTALIDAVDPSKKELLLREITNISRLDYIVSHHAEQDHSGSIPEVMAAHPESIVLATPRAKGMLVDLLQIPEHRIQTVEDSETVSLGDRTLEFLYTPWVHWPETMVSLLREEQILFTCDFYGSHLATSSLYVPDEQIVYEAAKRYYAEIMMPFRQAICNNIAKVEAHQFRMIAPSHGPVYDRPAFILDAYKDWVSDRVANQVLIPYVSMHGSTQRMVEHLTDELVKLRVQVQLFDLAVTDLGKLAIALVDAATVVMGTPIVHVGPHPSVFYAAHLTNALRPKVKFISVVGSYGWGGKAIEQIKGLIPNLKVELLPPVICRGYPRPQDFEALSVLARTIADKHRELGILRK